MPGETPAAGEERVQRLLDAVVAISSDLSLPHVLRRVAESACALVDARYGALGVIGPGAHGLGQSLVQFITVGADQETVRRIGHYPEGHGILGLLITDPKPRRIADIATDEHSYGFPPGHPAMHSFLGVPVRVRDQVFGILYLTEKNGPDGFTATDERLVVALAGAAGVAIENARLHTRVEELAVVQERERIARDLHDSVIQRLFATGMALQAVEGIAEGVPELGARIHQAVDDLDETIREIRGVIFALQAYERGENSLRVLTLGLAAEATAGLGFEPRIHFAGPIDAAVSDETAGHLQATLREALSNVARHAHATAVDIHLSAADDLVLRVVDNGIGVASKPPTPRGNGLRNMRHRARGLGGSCKVTPGKPRGTIVEWRVPFAASTLSLVHDNGS